MRRSSKQNKETNEALRTTLPLGWARGVGWLVGSVTTTGPGRPSYKTAHAATGEHAMVRIRTRAVPNRLHTTHWAGLKSATTMGARVRPLSA